VMYCSPERIFEGMLLTSVAAALALLASTTTKGFLRRGHAKVSRPVAALMSKESASASRTRAEETGTTTQFSGTGALPYAISRAARSARAREWPVASTTGRPRGSRLSTVFFGRRPASFRAAASPPPRRYTTMPTPDECSLAFRSVARAFAPVFPEPDWCMPATWNASRLPCVAGGPMLVPTNTPTAIPPGTRVRSHSETTRSRARSSLRNGKRTRWCFKYRSFVGAPPPHPRSAFGGVRF